MPAALVDGPETVSTSELGDRYGADPDDAQLVTRGARRLRAHRDRDPPGVAPAEGERDDRRDAVGVRHDADRASASPHPDGTGERPAPVPDRLRCRCPPSCPGSSPPCSASTTGRRPARSSAAARGIGARAARTRRTEQAAPPAAKGGPLTAPQVASFYQFPADTDGTGQTVAIIELGGGYTAVRPVHVLLRSRPRRSLGDRGRRRRRVQLPRPGRRRRGRAGHRGRRRGRAWRAQVVYFAPNTDQGFIDAISQAVHATPAPIAVSISWGQSEDQWSEQSRTAMDQAFADAAALGVTVTVAAGDNGVERRPERPDVGALRLPRLLAERARLRRDQARSATPRRSRSPPRWCGTSSRTTRAPAAAASPTCSRCRPSRRAPGCRRSAQRRQQRGRGVPDVAGNADPVTGYLVVVDGRQQPIGGTSAVAPLWAGLIARLAQATGKKLRPAPAAAVRGRHAAGAAARASTTSSQATTAPTAPAPAGTRAPASAPPTATRCSPCSAAPRRAAPS